jgi:hypothetical protein
MPTDNCILHCICWGSKKFAESPVERGNPWNLNQVMLAEGSNGVRPIEIGGCHNTKSVCTDYMRSTGQLTRPLLSAERSFF